MAFDLEGRLRTALKSRYAIERELGHGGMAIVYLAEDRKHDRRVAIKVLRPELAAALGPERFLREIRVAAQLSHPHIVPLYDSGQAGAFLYYAMPYVEGESLRSRIAREGQLPIAEAVQITREVADALSYAHSLGLVHRDIKPENILLSGGHALVADFGIARALDAAGGEMLTETGLAIGTPAYMSPEQGAATGKIDGRSDLYALGCVLYELLAGSPPFTGPTAQSILARHSVDPVPSLRSVRGTVHPGIEWAITKAMAKVPADRFATAAEFAEALTQPERAPIPERRRRRRFVGALAAVVIVLGVLLGLNVGGLKNRLLAREAIHSLAVLPIRNLTGDTSLVYMAEGMTDQFFTDLAQIKALRIIGRTWVMRSRDSIKSIQQIADTLGVDAALTGSLQRAGDSLHISAQLISAATGAALWAKSYDGVVTNILRLQNEVARDVAARIRVELSSEEHARLAGPGRAVDPAAYALYVKGRYYWNKQGAQNLKTALGFFTQALDVDPTYAAAYAGVAETYDQIGYGAGLPPNQAFPRAEAAAARALELDSTNAEAHAAFAYARLYYDWDWSSAERDFRTALTLNPNDPVAHSDYSLFLLAMGRFDEAEAEVQRAVQLDPLSAPIAAEAGWVSHYRGRQDEAVTRLRAAVAMDTANAAIHFRLGRAYQAQGRYREAMEEYTRNSSTTGVGAMGYVEGALGDRKAAMRRLRSLDSVRAAGAYVSPYVVALVYAGLGEENHMFEWLNKAVDERTHWIVWLNRDPRWKPWRSDPRFKAVGRRVGLPS